jgi:hypothetical protein
MSILPNKTLFIVTSALNADMGTISRDDRFEQTLRGLLSLRKKVPNAIVLLADGSPHKLEQEKIQALSRYANFVADFSGDKQINEFSVNHRKSEAENVLLIKTLLLFKQDYGLMKMLHSINRIFKLSGRTDILDDFNLEGHNHFGRYVFKKRIPTWLTDSRKELATDLLITRMFSFCPSLLNDYIDVMDSNIKLMIQTRIDTEHAHFLNIDKDYLVELDKIHCQGAVASTGEIEIY